MQFRSETLDNGLEIIAEVNPAAFSLALGYFVKTGSRDETPELAGVSHFLEHMMFKGTANRTSVQVNRELDDLGSQSNAYTSEEQTVYYMSVLPENQAHAIDLLSDMMRPSLNDDDFQMERQVIIEEIAMYDDQPPYGGMELAMEEFFGDHPLSRRVLGTRETVGAMEAEAMRAYHRARYASNNLTLVAAGAVDFDALVEDAKRLTSHWVPSDSSRYLAKPTVRDKESTLVHPPATQAYMLQYSMGAGYNDSARYAHRILSSILGDDTGSRLFWELVDNGLAESAVAFTQEFEECGLFCTYMACTPDARRANWQRLEDILRNGKSKPIQDREIELAKNKICSGMILSSERPGNRLFTIGNAWLNREKYETVAQATQNYQRVTKDELQATFERLADRKNITVSIVPEE
jgi:predicted Zn-dependent peptidase